MIFVNKCHACHSKRSAILIGSLMNNCKRHSRYFAAVMGCVTTFAMRLVNILPSRTYEIATTVVPSAMYNQYVLATFWKTNSRYNPIIAPAKPPKLV